MNLRGELFKVIHGGNVNKIDQVISLIADNIEGINVSPPVSSFPEVIHYFQGTKDERANIVKYLRGLLDN